MRESERVPYGELGELHDLFMHDVWEGLRPAVRDAFASLRSDQVLVDMGAGTGVGTTVIAQETHCRIWAIEPDLVMRAALTHRVSADPHLADRVTVVAGGVPEALSLLPDDIAGVVCAQCSGTSTAQAGTVSSRGALLGSRSVHHCS